MHGKCDSFTLLKYVGRERERKKKNNHFLTSMQTFFTCTHILSCLLNIEIHRLQLVSFGRLLVHLEWPYKNETTCTRFEKDAAFM